MISEVETILSQFFGNEGADIFLNQFWPYEKYITHDRIDNIQNMANILEFGSVEKLLKILDCPVDALGKGNEAVTRWNL